MREKIFAEVFGTFLLVFVGCGAAVLMGDEIGMLGVAIAFGLGMVAAAYLVGGVSGAHINPAVSLGMHLTGRLSRGDMFVYWVSQICGAVIAIFFVLLIASGTADYSVSGNGLGQNGYGSGYMGEYGAVSAFLFEFVASFIFVLVVLRTTDPDSGVGNIAGLLIGLTLLLVHLVGINVTGVSVNPARSIAPALFTGFAAIFDLWVFILAPMAGAWLAAFVVSGKLTSQIEKLFNTK